MKRTLLSLAVASVLGLSACSQQPEEVVSDQLLSSESSQVAERKAELRLTVNFPGSGSDRAQAALIDENAGLIGVYIRRIAAVTADEFDAVVRLCSNYGQVGGYDEFGNYTGDGDYDWQGNFVGSNLTPEEKAVCDLAQQDRDERTVTTVLLDPLNNSATVEVPVGKYEIYAAQYANEIDMKDGRRISGAKSFAELPEGAHSVMLTMTHGTWDLVDDTGAPTTIDFQLLNNATVLGELGIVDADPLTDGDQTPGEALGLTGSLSGFHLADKRYYERIFGDIDIGSDYDYDDDDYGMANLLPWIVTIPRIVDAQGVESDVIPRNEYFEDGGYDPTNENWIESTIQFDVAMMPGFHLQQYDGTQNTNQIMFGDYWVETDDRVAGTSFDSGILVKTSFDFLTPPTDDGTNWVYDNGDDGWVDTEERSYTLLDGSTASILVAYVSQESGTLTHPNTDPNLTDSPDAKTTDGTTIMGTLIEIVGAWEDLAPTIVADPAYTGEGPVMPPAAATRRSNVDLTKAANSAFNAYQLNKAAISAGLKASSAASGIANNCVILNETDSWYYTEFAWDETLSEWIPGAWNHTYYYNQFAGWDGVQYNPEITGSDLNGNGVIEPFESDVFNNNEYWNIEYVGYEDVLDVDGNVIGEVGIGNATQYFESSGNFYAVNENICTTDEGTGDTTCVEDTDQDGNPIPITEGTYQVDVNEMTSLDPDGDGRIEQYEEALVQENETGLTHACMHDFTLKGRQLDIAITPAETEVVIN